MTRQQRSRIEKLVNRKPQKPAVLIEGDVAAFGLVSGDCPIGVVDAIDAEFVRLRLWSAIDGTFGHRCIAVRRSKIEKMEFARRISLEEAKARGDFLLWGDETEATPFFDTAKLGPFQTEWVRRHASGEPKP